jgi:hypothetical protein
VADRPATTISACCWYLGVFVVDVDGLVTSLAKRAAIGDLGRAVRADIVMVI